MANQIQLKVSIDPAELRQWADWHADRHHHGPAHVLYQAAREAESLGEQAIREAEQRGAVKALREAADQLREIDPDRAAVYWTDGGYEFVHEWLDAQAEAAMRALGFKREGE